MKICVNAAVSFKDKSKRWYPVKNTCPLDSTSPTLLSPSISVSESYSSCVKVHPVETVVKRNVNTTLHFNGKNTKRKGLEHFVTLTWIYNLASHHGFKSLQFPALSKDLRRNGEKIQHVLWNNSGQEFLNATWCLALHRESSSTRGNSRVCFKPSTQGVSRSAMINTCQNV